MKQVIKEIIMEFLVKETDFATFDGEVVHSVYSTFSIARDAEWTGRQLFLANAEPGEEAVGTLVEVKHKSPAFLGDIVLIVANIESYQHGHLKCNFIAKVGDKIIAEGKTGQKIMPEKMLKTLLKKDE